MLSVCPVFPLICHDGLTTCACGGAVLALCCAGSFVEIGSDRGEGSTAYLSQFAERTGRDFFSVDFAPEGVANARRVCGACAYQGLGEEFLQNAFSTVSKFGTISFAYLDNYGKFACVLRRGCMLL